jgi:hypothetical protein
MALYIRPKGPPGRLLLYSRRMNDLTAYDKDLISALADLLAAAKGTMAERSVSIFVAEHVQDPAPALEGTVSGVLRSLFRFGPSDRPAEQWLHDAARREQTPSGGTFGFADDETGTTITPFGTLLPMEPAPVPAN